MSSKQFEIKIGVNSGGVVTGINSAIGQINRLASTARNIAAGFGIVGIASMVKNGIESLIKWGAEIEKTARANGLAVDTFQELSAASTELSIDLTDSTSAFKKLQLAQVEALKGNAETQRMFQRRGIELNRLREMTPKQAFDAVGDSFAKIAPSAQATADAVGLMGKSGVAMLGAFRGGFMDAMKDARSLGEVLDEKVVKSLAHADDAMTRFGLQAKVAIAGMIPPLIDLTSQILDATQATGIWLKTWWQNGGPSEGAVKSADKAVDEFFKLKEQNARDRAKYENPKADTPTNANGVISNSNGQTLAKPDSDKLLNIGGYRGGGEIARIPGQQLRVQQRMEQHLGRIAHYVEKGPPVSPAVSETINGLRDLVKALTGSAGGDYDLE